MEAFTYADDAVLERIGFRHPRLGQMTGTRLRAHRSRYATRSSPKCMPGFLVIGTQRAVPPPYTICSRAAGIKASV